MRFWSGRPLGVLAAALPLALVLVSPAIAAKRHFIVTAVEPKGGAAWLPGVMSRKKQVIPPLELAFR